jgi:hypothetical protein
MRVVVEEWIYTTLKKCKRKKTTSKKSNKCSSAEVKSKEKQLASVVSTPPGGAVAAIDSSPELNSNSSSDDHESYVEDYIIEERLVTEQNLFQSSPNEYLFSSSSSSVDFAFKETITVSKTIDRGGAAAQSQPEQYDNITSPPSKVTANKISPCQTSELHDVSLKFPTSNSELLFIQEHLPAPSAPPQPSLSPPPPPPPPPPPLKREKIDAPGSREPIKLTITHATRAAPVSSLIEPTASSTVSKISNEKPSLAELKSSKRVNFNDSRLEDVREIEALPLSSSSDAQKAKVVIKFDGLESKFDYDVKSAPRVNTNESLVIVGLNSPPPSPPLPSTQPVSLPFKNVSF